MSATSPLSVLHALALPLRRVATFQVALADIAGVMGCGEVDVELRGDSYWTISDVKFDVTRSGIADRALVDYCDGQIVNVPLPSTYRVNAGDTCTFLWTDRPVLTVNWE